MRPSSGTGGGTARTIARATEMRRNERYTSPHPRRQDNTLETKTCFRLRFMTATHRCFAILALGEKVPCASETSYFDKSQRRLTPSLSHNRDGALQCRRVAFGKLSRRPCSTTRRVKRVGRTERWTHTHLSSGVASLRGLPYRRGLTRGRVFCEATIPTYQTKTPRTSSKPSTSTPSKASSTQHQHQQQQQQQQHLTPMPRSLNPMVPLIRSVVTGPPLLSTKVKISSANILRFSA